MVSERGTGVTKRRAGFWSNHRWLTWLAGGLLLVLIALGVAISVALHRAEPILRAAIVEKLEERFHARVELDSFNVSLVNGLWAEGKGLRIWPPAHHPEDEDLSSGTPAQVVGVTVLGTNKAGANGAAAAVAPGPLIKLDEFRFHAPLSYMPGKPIRISVVELKGLVVDVPPKTQFTQATMAGGPSRGSSSGFGLLNTGAALLRFEVDSIECNGARLTVETSKAGKLPFEFAIAEIKLTGVSEGGSMHFDAELTNPRPPGTIVTSGSMGPWVVDDPGETPVAGDYRFERADLSVFKGIAGILSSTGKYQGVLRDLVVDGETETPDFRLTHFGTALPLETEFHAHVDGMNGDTWLQPVNATLGQSHFIAEGQIVRVPAGVLPNGTAQPGGHEIALKVNVQRGRIEDFLRLASKSGKPLLTGAMTLKTTLEIPPGMAPVDERMRLNGNFTLDQAAFTSAKIQDYVGQLSLRGQGDAKDAKRGEGTDVRSAMKSDFTMAGGVITLPNLKYTAPGAEIDLKGTYGVQGSILDFAGIAKTQATISQLVGGWKGALLKPADHLFRKDGAGTEVPIHIDGTPENPKFGIDFDRMKHTSPSSPGQQQ
jgi:hypothetical protein